MKRDLRLDSQVGAQALKEITGDLVVADPIVRQENPSTPGKRS